MVMIHHVDCLVTNACNRCIICRCISNIINFLYLKMIKGTVKKVQSVKMNHNVYL